MVVMCNDSNVFVTPERRSSGSVEDKHEKATRLALVAIALKNKPAQECHPLGQEAPRELAC